MVTGTYTWLLCGCGNFGLDWILWFVGGLFARLLSRLVVFAKLDWTGRTLWTAKDSRLAALCQGHVEAAGKGAVCRSLETVVGAHIFLECLTTVQVSIRMTTLVRRDLPGTISVLELWWTSQISLQRRTMRSSCKESTNLYNGILDHIYKTRQFASI